MISFDLQSLAIPESRLLKKPGEVDREVFNEVEEKVSRITGLN